MQKNTRYIVGALVLITAALFVWGYYSRTVGEGTARTAADILSVTPADHTKGNPDASITVIEYSDFECPACGVYYPVVKQLSQEYGDRALFVYRHFPLTNIHRNALSAGLSAEAAGRQGKFWEMHDLLFEGRSEWEGSADAPDIFFGYAETLGLVLDEFQNDINDKAVLDDIEASYRGGLFVGVNGTPTFFVNGTKIHNPQSYEAFAAVIESALTE